MSQIEVKRCGAKTKAGKSCKGLAMPNGRCRMHGGKSPRWFGHPRYKHGLYSKYSLEGIKQRAAVKRRKALRVKKKVIKVMSEGQLKAEARRILGPVLAPKLNAEEMREFLLAVCEIDLQQTYALQTPGFIQR